MNSFTYSQARQNLAKLLVLVQNEEIEIRHKDGAVFLLRSKHTGSKSPFDVPGIGTAANTSDIVDAIRESRDR